MKKITKNILRIGWLLFGIGPIVFLLMVFEGPDRHYYLDRNYQIWGWPGWIMKYDCEYNSFTEPVELDSKVTAFAITDRYIIGKTSQCYFAIDKNNSKVWYPYQSQKELSAVIGVNCAEVNYITSRPWTRLILSKQTKIGIPLTMVFYLLVAFSDIVISKMKRATAADSAGR